MKLYTFFILGLLLMCGLALANTADICRQFADVNVPVKDRPDAATISTLKNCEAKNWYYGLKQQPVDYNKARQCAYLKQDYETLTMLYANGKGVERNWDLAIHFACEAGFAPAEVEGRVNHLLQLKKANWQGSNFDICDDVTSGYMMGICADWQEELAQSAREEKLAKLTANWSPANKVALEKLQKAAESFFQTRAENEVDLSGTGRLAFQINEVAALRDDMINMLQKLNKGKLPNYKPEKWEKYNKKMDEIYQKILANKNFNLGSVNLAGVKKTQLAWIKYREAWVNFGKECYPQVNADAWRTWVTEKRLQMLYEFVNS